MSSGVQQQQDTQQWDYKEWPIPQIGTSPITGIEGTGNWGSLNKPDAFSRWVIGDSDLDDLVNIMPQTIQQKMVPALAQTPLVTLAATPIWDFTSILNGQVYHFCLCSNGHIYQVLVPAGTVTDLAGGFATSPPCDITVWQGTQIIIGDPIAQNIYSWNGSALTTVFSSQPNSYVAVYGGRLWISYGLTCTFTQGGTYNSFAGDSGSFALTDSSAANPIIGLVAFAGSLYFFGSNWIATLTNLQSSGTPAIVSFTFQILQGQIGIINKWSILMVGTNLYFANTYGFWQMSGAVPTKISDVIDGFFSNFTLSTSSWSAAFTQVLGEPLIMWNVNWNDPSGVAPGQTVFAYTAGGQFFRLSQGAITFITGTVSSATTNNFPLSWAIIGNSIYQMFAAPLVTQPANCNFKIWDFGSRTKFKLIDYIAVFVVVYGQTTVTLQMLGFDGALVGNAITKTLNPFSGYWVNRALVQGPWVNQSNVTGTWNGTGVSAYMDLGFNANFETRGFGFNLNITGFSIAIQSIVVGYRTAKLVGRGSPQQI